ncbi:hypothetical protein BD410DRAFT_824618 [Rickenella mellea]|uniref:Uncharacterized protein n=1 Tax=Rickenella mellea TaxID=50990 RepID=A0A4Y7QLM3_9AGAM|nr:hypothetical protein BD410DRAFT_824618 [Rickenella mellea]
MHATFDDISYCRMCLIGWWCLIGRWITVIACFSTCLASPAFSVHRNAAGAAICIGIFIAESDVFIIFTVFASIVMFSRSITVSLTSLCLRFDYHIHLEHSANLSPKPFAIDKVPSIPEDGVGPGAVVPSRIPTKFSKPYSITSIVTFVVVAAATLASPSLLGINLDRQAARGFFFVTEGAIFSPQFLAVIGMAWLRGDWKILTQYKEEWAREPIPTKSDIDLEKGSGGKETELLVNVKDAHSDGKLSLGAEIVSGFRRAIGHSHLLESVVKASSQMLAIWSPSGKNSVLLVLEQARFDEYCGGHRAAFGA